MSTNTVKSEELAKKNKSLNSSPKRFPKRMKKHSIDKIYRPIFLSLFILRCDS